MTSLRTVFSRGAYRALGILAISLVVGASAHAETAAGSGGRADAVGRSARSR